ncbi:hypothetical protein GM182_03435 [bacterium 3DAC]|nr:hypothetical protein GM182_03435 [bacterium 3DAC]
MPKDKKSGIESLKRVAVYRKGDKIVVGEYTPKSSEETGHDPVKEQVEQYTQKIREYYEGILESVKERAYKEAYENGYTDGYNKAYIDAGEKVKATLDEYIAQIEMIHTEISRLRDELQQINVSIKREIENIYSDMERQLLMMLPEVIAEITKAISGKALDVDNEFLEGYVKQAISKLKGSEVIELRVPSHLYEKVSKIADKIMETDINIRKIVVNEDPHVDVGVIADSQLGLVDARLSSAIDNLRELIKEVMGYYAQTSIGGSQKKG